MQLTLAICEDEPTTRQQITSALSKIGRTLTREKVVFKSEMRLDARRSVHSQYKSNRLTKIHEQISVVQGTITEKINTIVEKTDNDQKVAETLQNKSLINQRAGRLKTVISIPSL